jgi:hypothetical protein
VQANIIDSMGLQYRQAAPAPSRTEAFAQVLSSKQVPAEPEARMDPATRAKLREAAEQFVASALVLPMLKGMQQDPFRSDLFHGGMGEDAFQSQLDTILADRITSRSRFPLVDSIMEQVLRRYSRPALEKGVDTHG